MSGSEGKSVRLFLVDGTPGGLVTAEIMNWTGHVIAGPRSAIARLVKRPEASKTGVYLLLGDGTSASARQTLYVGEGDDIRTRLTQHVRPHSDGGKDFWDRAVLLTSKDANLTKAHARYLESRILTLAAEADRVTIDNRTAPPPTQLPEADVSDMEFYIKQVQIVLPVLGINALRAASRSDSTPDHAEPTPAVSPRFELRQPKLGLVSYAREVDGEFTVLAESQARRDTTKASRASIANMREQLLADGILKDAGGGEHYVFAKDATFTSPSAAGVVVTGRSCNGRVSWRMVDSGLTYGEWQAQGVE